MDRFEKQFDNNTLLNEFESMGSHLCTKIIFFFTNTMRLHFCISDGDRQGFHRDMIIDIRVFFIFILPLLNEISVFSR